MCPQTNHGTRCLNKLRVTRPTDRPTTDGPTNQPSPPLQINNNSQGRGGSTLIGWHGL